MNRAPLRSLAFPALLSLLAILACRDKESSSPPPAPPGETVSIQVLMNPDFEQASPLIWKGDTGIIQPAPGAGSPGIVPHGGTKFAWLGGYGAAAADQITQDFFIPTSAQSASATFYVKILTEETGSTATDAFTVTALDTANAPLATLLTKSNLDAGNYTAHSVNLLPHKGRTLRLSFRSQEDAQRATSFLLEDVVVNLSVPDAADLKPIITSFTPTSGIAGERTVQISGRNFFGLTGLSFGTASATYLLSDGTALSATVPANAALGNVPINLTNAQGTGTSATPFQVYLGLPVIAGLNPTQGPVGTPVVVTGSYLGHPGTTITLNGLAITPTAQSASQITFTVPVGGTSGNLVISSPGGTATRPFTVNAAGTTVDFHIERVQLIQSTQNPQHSVPIVAGKNGLIRVFVLANQANAAAPSVQVTLLNGGMPVAGYPKTVTAPGSSVPTSLDESALGATWNLEVPGTDLTTPTGSGYGLQAVVDHGNALNEADETNNSTLAALAGTTVPTFKTTLFPVALASGTGDVSSANQGAWVARLAKMYPVASVDVAVGATFTSSVALQAKGDGWDTLLNELRTKHQADGALDRYYFGAVKVGYSSGVAGLGYVPNAPSSGFSFRTALGWDKATGYADGGLYPEVFAHETGHNMGRPHSPCGGVDTSDPDYPYPDGSIGAWGYDSTSNQLKAPTVYKDIMGYCTPNWVSDYVYTKILEFRGGSGGFIQVGAEDAAPPKPLAQARECLIVRGIVHGDGEVQMLPSFRTRALPSAPPAEGTFLLEGLDAQDRPIFQVPLELVDLGCWPGGQERHFVMALPLEPSQLDALVGLQVLKAGRPVTRLRALPSPARILSAPPELRRIRENQVQVSWDATLHPALLVRDGDSGEVLALLSGGRQTLLTRARRFELVLSDGVSGRTHRLECPE